MGGLIIPGVQVSVVKEALPQQLSPSGILGIVGFTEKIPDASGGLERASDWNRLVDVFGRATALSLPEARQALDNGVSQLVVSPLPASAGAPATLSIPVSGGGADKNLNLTARARGTWANGITVVISSRRLPDQTSAFDLTIQGPDGAELERHRNLSINANSDRYVVTALQRSAILSASPGSGAPIDGPYPLAGGADATVDEYLAALQRLTGEPDVDMVLVAVQVPPARRADLIRIYSGVISHCEEMSGESKGRLGFGQILAGDTAAMAAEMASYLVSDRFVLVAPNGVVGAVAGRIGNLDYYQSPTFKTLAGLGVVRPALDVESQKALLTAHVVPVVVERGKGTVVLRGLTTDGDQINVRRIADRAVRTMKMIGDLFIGRLNNADGREALKQKLTEALLQMANEGAIVPSTDGKDPAFKVAVHSSQADFALGIVRVDMAVRPVRAIDYIYATILVQV